MGDRILVTYEQWVRRVERRLNLLERRRSGGGGGGGGIAQQGAGGAIGVNGPRPNASTPTPWFPPGLSMYEYTSAETAAAGWPPVTAQGLLLVFRGVSDRTVQILFRGSPFTPLHAFFRSSDSLTTWSGWQNMAGPFGQATGQVNLTGTANVPREVTVTFPAGRFTQTPHVLVANTTGVNSAATTQVIWSTSVSSTSMVIGVNRSNGTGVTVRWMATQANSGAGMGAVTAPAVESDSTATCPTVGCENQGVAIAICTRSQDEDGVVHVVDDVVCGVCGTRLTAVPYT